MVRIAGLEPARVTPLPPQSSVSANSTICAHEAANNEAGKVSTCKRFPDRELSVRKNPSTKIQAPEKPQTPILKVDYFVRSAAVGGPSTQFTSQAVSTVMKVRESALSQASWTILAGNRLKEPTPCSIFFLSQAKVAFPLMMVWLSFPECQCLRT